MLRAILKHVAFLALGNGLRASVRLAALARSRNRVVLSLHRVGEPDGSAYVPMRPDLFEELLVFLSRNFSLQTFGNPEPANGRPVAILSFDDGYRDFFDVAAPLLRKHRIRCNHNVIPECIETGMPPLNVLAQDFVGKAPRELVDKLQVPGFAIKSHRDIGDRLSTFIKSKPVAEQQRLAEHLVPQFSAWEEFRPTAMMTHEQVCELAVEHEIGAHSYGHASMQTKTLEYLKQDVERCRAYFLDRLRLPMEIYAFPNGSCTEEQVRVVEQAGVKHVLLVGEAFDTHPSRHYRFTFDAHSRAEMRFKALGGLRRISFPPRRMHG